MTDKEQIIIDGKGCRYKTWDAECSLTGDHYGDNMEPCKFIDEKSCYYKQLARKTQECDTLKSQLDFEAQQKELDEYKQSLDEKNKFLQDLGISAGGEFKRIKFYIESLKNKYNEKVKECEELKERKLKLELNENHNKNEIKKLKKRIRKDREFFKNKISSLTVARKEFLEALAHFNWQIGLVKNDCYREALEEIECIAKDQEKWAFEASRKCANQILSIIDRVKGDSINE